MKKVFKFSIIITSIITIAALLYSILSYRDTKVEVVISEDYSQIHYNNQTYVPYSTSDINELPAFSQDRINARVENESLFWNSFSTNYIFISMDNRFIHLMTDYDMNESDYYVLKE